MPSTWNNMCNTSRCQKITKSLEVMLCPLLYRAACISFGGLICYRWDFFPLLFLSSLENYNLVIYVVNSNLIIILFISNFFLNYLVLIQP